MTINRNLYRRPAALLSALALVLGVVSPALVGAVANAAQVTTRSIQMSDSTASASSVTYKVTFTPGTTQAATGGLIIDFCGDSPIVGATCAFAAGTVPDVSSATSSTGTFATVGTGTPKHTVMITGLSFTSGTAFTLNLTGMKNPTSTTSFYARILTYSSTANASTYVPANVTGGATTTGTYLDYGGIALSTANNIPISATVMETLTFCVSGLVTGAAPTTCAGATVPSVTLGSGSPQTIDANAVYNNSAGASRSYMVLSTNAMTGASVSMKSGYTCTGLSRNGGTSCDIAGNGTTTPIAAGAGQFGLYVNPGSGGTGAITGTANYSTANLYYVGANVASTSTYGDPIATTGNNPCANVVSQLTFGTSAATTTPAGVYSTNEILIATGTF